MLSSKKSTSNKKILWYTLAFMAFNSVWSFGNVLNGFTYFDGVKAAGSWILVLALYFIPYALIVSELGTTFKEEGGGVSSWIDKTIGPKIAYYAGWTYWIVHMPYISQKPQTCLIALSWALFRDRRISNMNVTLLQLISLAVFLFAMYLASKGLGVLKRLSSIAGIAMLVMSILFIIMIPAAPALVGAKTTTINWSWKTFMPSFDAKFFLNLSILIFAVGGCEKIAPYVNKTKDPGKGFPRAMILLAVMVGVTAVLGAIALGMVFNSNHLPKDLLTNGAYVAFQHLGRYYHVGNLFTVLYALTNLLAQFAALILSIDAPLRILLESTSDDFIPAPLFKKNQYGAYINGEKMVTIIVSILILIPAFGIGSVNNMVSWLVKLNSVCMPMRFMWVFVAYIALKKAKEDLPRDYYFVKSRSAGMFWGGWCFAITALTCIMGMYSTDTFQLVMNILIPFILLGLGVIMPKLAQRGKRAKAA